jgi:hypothetical protein
VLLLTVERNENIMTSKVNSLLERLSCCWVCVDDSLSAQSAHTCFEYKHFMIPGVYIVPVLYILFMKLVEFYYTYFSLLCNFQWLIIFISRQRWASTN